MKACMQSSNSTTPCTTCGQRPGELHRPIFKRGAFCPGCCPVCAPAQQREKAQPKLAPSAPRPRDPFYFDERRLDRGVDYLQPGGATRLRRGR